MGVVAYHVIITNYGFWLPNDPRGSWSDLVRLVGIVSGGRFGNESGHAPIRRRRVP